MRRDTDRSASRDDAWRVERVIVLQLLRADRLKCWSRAELAGELRDFEPAVAEQALARLEREGLVRCKALHVCASPATRRLDELELIAV